MPFASPDQLFDYVEAATRAREYNKFVFSKGLFFILEQIAEFGQRHDIETRTGAVGSRYAYAMHRQNK